MSINNHPAYGPLSVGRLYQIREYLEHNSQYQNGGNRAYILADMLKVIDEVLATRAVTVMLPKDHVDKADLLDWGSVALLDALKEVCADARVTAEITDAGIRENDG